MFKCPICERELKNNRSIVNHVRIHKEYTQQSYYDSFVKKENEGVCEECGKETKFYGFQRGYARFCSYNCSCKNTNNKEEVREKIKNTLEERYGDRNYVNVDAIKKVKKEKYGYDYFPEYDQMRKLSDEEEKERLEKIKRTKEERYGDSSYCNVEKIKKTKRERYGRENYNNIEQIKITNNNKSAKDKIKRINKIHEKSLINSIKHFECKIKEKKLHVKIIDVKRHPVCNRYVLKCLKCDNIFEIQRILLRKRIIEERVVCTHCNPLYNTQTSKQEEEIFNFIKDNTNLEVLCRLKNIIHPYELDIYIPELKLAFEFNGLYWHNELYKDNYYHLNKTELCEEKGIHLIHIYEDDWNFKEDIVKSRILNLLGKSKKVYAKNCKIKEVSTDFARKFYDKNHLQGRVLNGNIAFGLVDNNGEVISIMMFSDLRSTVGQTPKNNCYELLRFCNKLNHTVIGGAEKLFKYFIKEYNPEEVISYADRSWTMNSGNTLYDKLGFGFDKITRISYHYIFNGKRMHRDNFRKEILIEQGFDKNKSTYDIMFERGIYRIYNSGNLKYKYKK